nr:glutamine synthetase family protein [Amycolatopsis panacis]
MGDLLDLDGSTECEADGERLPGFGACEAGQIEWDPVAERGAAGDQRVRLGEPEARYGDLTRHAEHATATARQPELTRHDATAGDPPDRAKRAEHATGPAGQLNRTGRTEHTTATAEQLRQAKPLNHATRTAEHPDQADRNTAESDSPNRTKHAPTTAGPPDRTDHAATDTGQQDRTGHAEHTTTNAGPPDRTRHATATGPGPLDRTGLAERGAAEAGRLARAGVELVALTFVDNSGISRVKAVPAGRLAEVAAWGVGASNAFDFFLCTDEIATGTYSLGPVGDLRLHPDLDALTVLVAQPGWAWAPVWKYDQDGVPHPQDARALAATAADRLAAQGLSARMAFELEWVITDPDGVPIVGPAYGYTRLSAHSGYLRTLVSTLDRQHVAVEQIHPEYAAGQFELSVAATDPVHAADLAVLARETVRTVSAAHGFRASFTPKFIPGGVGNGGHVHLSLWDGERNLYAGGTGPFGLTDTAASFAAGIFARLPALLAIGAPSVLSYLRLEPHHWAGVFTAWGWENREAPLRLIRGADGQRETAANLEVKCFDLTANPYLVVAALLFAGLSGVTTGATLPAPVDVDPGLLGPDAAADAGVTRLPQSLAEAVAAFEADDVLPAAFGPPLATTLMDVRRAELSALGELAPDDLCTVMRWLH